MALQVGDVVEGEEALLEVAHHREVAAAIELTTVANVQVKEDADGEPALLEVNPRFPGTMPLTIAAGVDMPRLAIGEALGTAIPDGPLAFADIADLQRHAAEIAS